LFGAAKRKKKTPQVLYSGRWLGGQRHRGLSAEKKKMMKKKKKKRMKGLEARRGRKRREEKLTGRNGSWCGRLGHGRGGLGGVMGLVIKGDVVMNREGGGET
jgi:hypothetical protein